MLSLRDVMDKDEANKEMLQFVCKFFKALLIYRAALQLNANVKHAQPKFCLEMGFIGSVTNMIIKTQEGKVEGNLT